MSLAERLAAAFPTLVDADFHYWAERGPTSLLEQVLRPQLVNLAEADDVYTLRAILSWIEQQLATADQADRVAIHTGVLEGLVAADYRTVPAMIPLMGERTRAGCRALAPHFAIPEPYMQLLLADH